MVWIEIRTYGTGWMGEMSHNKWVIILGWKETGRNQSHSAIANWQTGQIIGQRSRNLEKIKGKDSWYFIIWFTIITTGNNFVTIVTCDTVTLSILLNLEENKTSRE